VPEIVGNRDIGVGAPQELADVDFAIVCAAFAVAETGSVLLSESELHVNALAYLAQHLIVLLDPADIVVNIHHAYGRPEFRSRRYACFHTGPSATADIEGVRIHGARPACSSCLHTGAPGFALISFARPPSISFAVTFCAAAPLRFRGATRHRSSRCAATLSMTICVSVSLMDMNITLRVVFGARTIREPH
jgi:hypothetical protein